MGPRPFDHPIDLIVQAPAPRRVRHVARTRASRDHRVASSPVFEEGAGMEPDLERVGVPGVFLGRLEVQLEVVHPAVLVRFGQVVAGVRRHLHLHLLRSTDLRTIMFTDQSLQSTV